MRDVRLSLSGTARKALEDALDTWLGEYALPSEAGFGQLCAATEIAKVLPDTEAIFPHGKWGTIQCLQDDRDRAVNAALPPEAGKE